MGSINNALKATKLYYGLEDCSGMFKNCTNLEEVDLTDIHNPEDIKNMNSIFENCSSLKSIDLSNFDTSNLNNVSNMFEGVPTSVDWHYDGTNYTSWTLTEGQAKYSGTFPWNIVTVAKYTFTSTKDTLPTFNSEFTNYTTTDVDNGDGTTTRSITIDKTSTLPTSISFSDKTSLLSVEELDTSNVTNMYSMFSNCYKLTSLDLSSFDTSNVTKMNSMFFNCKSLTSLDLSNCDISNVTDMGAMFYNCSKLTSLDLSNCDTSNVTIMDSMFHSCTSLTSLDLSNFNTSKVADMEDMFRSCTSLTSLDLSNFNTSKVADMSDMFRDCSSLSSLDLTSFNTSAVTSSSNMFYNCPESCVVRYNATSWTLATSGTGFNVIFANVSSGGSN